jgi:hypothetical protein
MPKIEEFCLVYCKRLSGSETLTLGILAHFSHFSHCPYLILELLWNFFLRL